MSGWADKKTGSSWYPERHQEPYRQIIRDGGVLSEQLL